MSTNTNDHTDTTGLTSGTVPPPPIGDNSANRDMSLPDAATVHLQFLAAYDALSRHEIAADIARQKIAYLIHLRHEVSFSGTEPTLFKLALDSYKIWSEKEGTIRLSGPLLKYFDALTDEMMGEAVFANNNKRKAFRTRILRAFKLALCIAFNGGSFRDFDEDTGRLYVQPQHFVPFGYMAMPSLTHKVNDDGSAGDKIERMHIGDEAPVLNEGTKHAKQVQFSIAPLHAVAKVEPIYASLAQYIYATDRRIEKWIDPNATPAEPTPAQAAKAAKAQRAPAAPGSDNRTEINKLDTDASMLLASADTKAKEAAADKAKAAELDSKAKQLELANAKAISDMSQTELGITPTTDTAATDLETLVAKLNDIMPLVDKLLLHDQILL